MVGSAVFAHWLGRRTSRTRGLLLYAVLQHTFAASGVIVFVLQVVCQIHQVMLGLYVLNARSKHTGVILCLTSLLHRGAIWNSYMEQLRPAMHDLLDDTFEESSQEELGHNEASIDPIRFEHGARTPDGHPSDTGGQG